MTASTEYVRGLRDARQILLDYAGIRMKLARSCPEFGEEGPQNIGEAMGSIHRTIYCELNVVATRLEDAIWRLTDGQ